MRVTCGVDVGSGFVDLGVDGKSCCINRLLALNNLSFLIGENQVRDGDQAEMFRQWVQPKMIGEDGIANTLLAISTKTKVCDVNPLTDMACNSFIVPTISKDSESSGKVLLAIQPLRLQVVKFWISSDVELLACRCPTNSA